MTFPQRLRAFAAAWLCVCLGAPQAQAQSPAQGDYPDDPLARGGALAVDQVWSGHPADFSLLTVQRVQVVAYYNRNRQVTLAARNLNSTAWQRLALDSRVGWDSHNDLNLAVDANGHLHLSGNMHADPMNYWRSAQPLTDAAQLATAGFMQRLPLLVNTSEERLATYPTFLTSPRGEFIFTYRNHNDSGHSSGRWHVLRYDADAKRFSRLTGPNGLFEWTGHYSVYPTFTVDDKYVHVVWMWRATTDAATNYRLSYARSADLVRWSDAFGRAVSLPLTPDHEQTIVDDVRRGGGLLNGQPRLGLDRDGTPLVAYHRYDGNGLSQVYVARPDATAQRWSTRRLTQSSWTWAFSGGGSLPPGGAVSNSFEDDDPLDGIVNLSVTFRRPDGTREPASGRYQLDETSLAPLTPPPSTQNYLSAGKPKCANGFDDPSAVENTFTHNGQAMAVRRSRSTGVAYAEDHYYLRWETLPANRDAPRYDAAGNEINPPASRLRLYRTGCEFGAPVRNAAGQLAGLMFKPAAARRVGAMTLGTDAGRPFGSYLSSGSSGVGSFAEWSFTLEEPREVVLAGGVWASAQGNSFFVQVDDGPLVDWHFSGLWSYWPVTAGPTRAATSFALAAGAHTLRVYPREPGARVDHLWLSPAGGGKSTAARLRGNQGFVLKPDAKAVSGQSLQMPAGTASSATAARYEIAVEQSGDYVLLARTRASSGSADSFFISVNGGEFAPWNVPLSAAQWTWRAVWGQPRSLSAGTLRLDVMGREAGAELDSFILLRR